ncbi:MAG TPA: SRPBCC domain-containing protein [Anaerolineales bacterium]
MAKELTLKRTFDAPRELVFKAWTDPVLVPKWWGPTGFTTPISEVEARQGGKLYIVMHGPKGSDFDIDLPVWGVFQEFDPPRKLVFTNEAMPDEQGTPQLATLCTVTFAETGGKTEMTLHIVLVKASPAASAWGGAEMGWNQSLDKLADFLAGYAGESQAKKTKAAAQ